MRVSELHSAEKTFLSRSYQISVYLCHDCFLFLSCFSPCSKMRWQTARTWAPRAPTASARPSPMRTRGPSCPLRCTRRWRRTAASRPRCTTPKMLRIGGCKSTEKSALGFNFPGCPLAVGVHSFCQTLSVRIYKSQISVMAILVTEAWFRVFSLGFIFKLALKFQTDWPHDWPLFNSSRSIN